MTGGGGFLGGAVVDELRKRGVKDIGIPRSTEFDLLKMEDCANALKGADLVIHCAAHVGGIALNKEKPTELFYDNAVMGMNVLHQSKEAGVKKIVFIGTACSYPKDAAMPLRESDLMKGEPDPVTGPYGKAKRLLLPLARTYRQQFGLSFAYLIPTNLYGPADHFDPVYGHVIPSLVQRMIEAKEKNEKTFPVWGTGKATREFLFIRDAAEAIVRAAESYDSDEPMNLGTGIETPIKELVTLLAEIIGYEGEIVWDSSKPDGNMRRVMDISRMKKELGFTAKTDLAEGLQETVDWFKKNR